MAMSGISQRLTRTSVEGKDNIDEKDKKIDAEDVEDQPPRRMSRIDRGNSVVGPGSSDTDVSLGALIDAEKDHSIKYRTCSWQKVRSIPVE
jgi:hypothetical protein